MKIIDQIRFAQSDPEEMTKIIAQFLPLLKKYARKLFYSDALFDLQADFIELVQNFDVLEFHPDDNPHILSYINRSMKNAYIKYIIICIFASVKKEFAPKNHSQILYL